PPAPRGRAAWSTRSCRVRRWQPRRPRAANPARGARAGLRVRPRPSPRAGRRARSPNGMERTLILVKPDAFARGLTGEIIGRFERKGLRLAALKQMTMAHELAERHYAEHQGKPFYEELVTFIISGPLVAMVLEGDQAVTAARQVIGATDPIEAVPGSIRGDYAIEVGQNMVHGSDSPQS